METPLYCISSTSQYDSVSHTSKEAGLKSVFGPEGRALCSATALSQAFKYQRPVTCYRNELADWKILAETAKRAKQPFEEAEARFRCAMLLDQMKEFRKAITRYQRCIEIYSCQVQEMSDQTNLATCYNHLANAYLLLSLKQLNLAQFSFFLDSYREKRLDHALVEKAIHYHRIFLKMGSEATQTSIQSVIGLTNLGLCHSLLGDAQKTLKYYQDALSIALSQEKNAGRNDYYLAICFANAGMARLRFSVLTTDRLKEARENFFNCADISAGHHLLELQFCSYRQLAYISHALWKQEHESETGAKDQRQESENFSLVQEYITKGERIAAHADYRTLSCLLQCDKGVLSNNTQR